MENIELAYWITLAHLPKIYTRKKNEIIIKFFQENKTIIDFFESDENSWKTEYNLDNKHIEILKKEKEKIANNSFIAENLISQNYKLIPITSKKYSPLLKKNLKKNAPPLLYIKGNEKILFEEAIAIVGSRQPNQISLDFTKNIAKKASKEFKVVVSGFAKGIDKQALDAALENIGHSIIVLPQGILTFNTGFKKYYKRISSGDLLVLSIFPPNSPWSVQLAMARNPIIYALADEIFVAESNDKGGTWAGVLDGLKKRRKIYVRLPNVDEKNANSQLIQKGAIPIDKNGKIFEYNIEDSIIKVSEPNIDPEYQSDKIQTTPEQQSLF